MIVAASSALAGSVPFLHGQIHSCAIFSLRQLAWGAASKGARIVALARILM